MLCHYDRREHEEEEISSRLSSLNRRTRARAITPLITLSFVARAYARPCGGFLAAALSLPVGAVRTKETKYVSTNGSCCRQS